MTKIVLALLAIAPTPWMAASAQGLKHSLLRRGQIVDDHFARASLIGGKVANQDIVELRPAKPSH